MTNPNSEPKTTTIRLTDPQRSALECAGLDDATEPGLIALFEAWDGRNTLDVTPDTLEAIMDGLIDRINAEDAQAEEQHDRKARGACNALECLSRRLGQLRRPERERNEDDGQTYGHPSEAR
jgi:hypothetical protein